VVVRLTKGGGIVTRRHVRSQQEWHCLPRWEPMVKDRTNASTSTARHDTARDAAGQIAGTRRHSPGRAHPTRQQAAGQTAPSTRPPTAPEGTLAASPAKQITPGTRQHTSDPAQHKHTTLKLAVQGLHLTDAQGTFTSTPM
jgi:hypothetical protein